MHAYAKTKKQIGDAETATRMYLKVIIVPLARIRKPTGDVKIVRKMFLKVIFALLAKIKRQIGSVKTKCTIMPMVQRVLNATIRRLVGIAINATGTLLMVIHAENVGKKLDYFCFILKNNKVLFQTYNKIISKFFVRTLSFEIIIINI